MDMSFLSQFKNINCADASLAQGCSFFEMHWKKLIELFTRSRNTSSCIQNIDFVTVMLLYETYLEINKLIQIC